MIVQVIFSKALRSSFFICKLQDHLLHATHEDVLYNVSAARKSDEKITETGKKEGDGVSF